MAKAKEDLLQITLARTSKSLARLMFEYKRMLDIGCCLIDDQDRRALFRQACDDGIRFSVGMSMENALKFVQRDGECDDNE